MKNKKICILTSVHSPFDSRIFYKEAKSLVEAGYSVTLIAPHNKNEVVDGINIIGVPKPRNRFERMTYTTLYILRLALKEKPIVYHFHDPELIPVCFLLKLLTYRKIVYDIHENVPTQILTKPWIPPYLRVIISKIIAGLERAMLPLFDAIIVAGKDIIEHLSLFDKIVVLNNFPLLKFIRNVDIEKKRRKETTLIYVGELTKDRGINEMVSSLDYIKSNVKLVLVGKFYPPNLERKIKGKDKVELIGWVPYKVIFNYLAEADIGLILLHPIPNNLFIYSGRNNKIFEYMGAGLPIVGSDFGNDNNLLLNEGSGITVDPLNPKEIAKAIEYLIEHPDEAKKMGENGRKAVLEKYNWENESKKLLKLYEKLC